MNAPSARRLANWELEERQGMMSKTETEKCLLGAVIGLIAGVVATGPMTVAMLLWHRRLPRHERYPLPPREITMKLARKAGVAGKMTSEERSAATFLAHFGYGGAAGAIYGAIIDEVPVRPVLKGIGFGLLVWTGSYLGFLPGMGILHSATRHPARRNLLMIGAHVVWGAATGLVTGLFKEEARGVGSRPFSSVSLRHKDTKAPAEGVRPRR
jgi:putative membrane protein